MNNADKALILLKTHGPQTAQSLAKLLALTSMGARKQLEAWKGKGLVTCDDRAEGVGRPARYWQLTALGHGRFPDRHSELTVQLIDSIREEFGEEGLERLIKRRERASELNYRACLPADIGIEGRLTVLAKVRSEEGYMAEAISLAGDGGWMLIENHCPISAAARACEGLCRSELELFARVLGNDVEVRRADHLIAGARRCVYLVEPKAGVAR